MHQRNPEVKLMKKADYAVKLIKVIVKVVI